MQHLDLLEGFRASDARGSLPSCFRGFFMNIIGYILPVRGKEGTDKAASSTGQLPGQEGKGLSFPRALGPPCPGSGPGPPSSSQALPIPGQVLGSERLPRCLLVLFISHGDPEVTNILTHADGGRAASALEPPVRGLGTGTHARMHTLTYECVHIHARMHSTLPSR